MDFAILEELKDAAEAIDFSKPADVERTVENTSEDTTARRREFATLMRSIKSLVRESE